MSDIPQSDPRATRLSPGARTLSAAELEEAPEYRPVCGTALLGLLLGMASPLALLAWPAWIVPLFGVVSSFFGLRRMAASDVPRLGRKAALAGLGLSMVFLVAGPAKAYFRHAMMRDEARRFADYWFDFLRNRQTYKAYELTLLPERRDPLDDAVSQYYRAGTQQRALVVGFARSQPMQTVLALGERAQCQYYCAERPIADETTGEFALPLVYAVTFDGDDGPTSFFVRVTVKRSVPANRGAYWQISKWESGVRPTGWEAAKEKDRG
jgi:hypothetical protein